jgi:hypothetical protein
MSEVTRILSAIEQGDPQAAGHLLPLVYDELRKLAARKLAQEKPGQTLEPTALVHEAYLWLVDAEETPTGTVGATSSPPPRRPCAAFSSRTRGEKKRTKHGGDIERVEIEIADLPTRMSSNELIALDEPWRNSSNTTGSRRSLWACAISRG